HRQRGVENIRRSEPLVHPARRRPHGIRDVLKKRDDIVIGPFLDLDDLGDGKASAFPDFGGVSLWNLAQLRHCFARERFDFEPDLEFAFLRPELTHLRSGITIDHSAKIKSGNRNGKRFVRKKASLRRNRTAEATLFESLETRG